MEYQSDVDKQSFGQPDSWFIEKYFKHDDETLEEAKACVESEQNAKKNARERKESYV